MRTTYRFAEITFETSDFKMDAGVDWDFDDNTANIEFFFDGYQLSETEDKTLLDAIRSNFSNVTDSFSTYDEDGDTRVEVFIDTSKCDETEVNNMLMFFAPILFSLWQGKLTIEDK